MAQPKGGELGARRPLALRVGQRDFEFQGLQNEWDPGGIDLGAFQDAVNVHFKGGRACCRGGLTKYGDAITGEVIGLYDDREDYVAPGSYGDEFGGTPTETVWFVIEDPAAGYGAGYWDGTQVVMVEDQAGVGYTILVQNGPGGAMYIAGGVTLYSLAALDIAEIDSIEGQFVSRGAAWDPVTESLWFASSVGDILIFDGATLSSSEQATAETIYMLTTYGTEYQVVTAAGLLQRNGGAWDETFSWPDFGSEVLWGASSWFVRGSTLWLALITFDSGAFTFSLRLLTFDGATVTLEHTISGIFGGALSRVVGTEPLYYAYYETATDEIHIGRYSGGVFNDDWCVGDGTTYGTPTELVAHSDGYFLLATGNGYLLKSGADPTDFSSYTEVATGLGVGGIFWAWQERSAA